MVNLVPAKCPNCGAQLELDDNMKKAECSFCKSTIIVDDAIAKYKIEVSGKVEVNGIKGFDKRIEDAKKFIKLEKYIDAKRTLDLVLAEDPFNYEAIYEWLKAYIFMYRRDPLHDKFNEKLSRADAPRFWVAINQIVEQYEKLKKLDEKEEYKKHLKDMIDDLDYIDEQYNLLLEDEKKLDVYNKEIHKLISYNNYKDALYLLFQLMGIDAAYPWYSSWTQSHIPQGSGQSCDYSFSYASIHRNGKVELVYTEHYDPNGYHKIFVPKDGVMDSSSALEKAEQYVNYLKSGDYYSFIRAKLDKEKQQKKEERKEKISKFVGLFKKKKDN